MNKPDRVKRKAEQLKRKAEQLKRKAEQLKRKAEQPKRKAEEPKRKAEELKRKAEELKRKTEELKCKTGEPKRKAEAVKLLLKSIMKTLKTTVHYYTIHYKLCGGKMYKTENEVFNYNQKIGAMQTNPHFIVGAKEYRKSVLRLAGNIQERFVTEKSPLAGIAGSIGQHGNGTAGLVRKYHRKQSIIIHFCNITLHAFSFSRRQMSGNHVVACGAGGSKGRYGFVVRTAHIANRRAVEGLERICP